MASASTDPLKICLTGSTEKALPQYGKAFTQGAQMALLELKGESKRLAEINVNYYENSPLAPKQKIQELIKSGCKAILGFSTGNDLLAIYPTLKEHKNIFVLSIYGDPNDSFEKNVPLRTMQPSAKELVSYLFDKLPFQITKNNSLLIITAIDRTEMNSYKDAYSDRLKMLGVKAEEVSVVEQTHDLSGVVNKLNSNHSWDYVILLTRSSLAAEIADLFGKTKKPIFLGTKYMGSNELPAFYNYLKNKNINAYFSRQNCTCDKSTDIQELIKKYERIFSETPMSISLDAYDAMKFLLLGLESSKKDQKSLAQFYTHNLNYKGPTSFQVSKEVFSYTNRYMINVNSSGYHLIE